MSDFKNELSNAYLNIVDLENTLDGCRTNSFDGDSDIDGNELYNILITDAPRRHGGTLNSDTVGDLIDDVKLFIENLLNEVSESEVK